MKETPQLRFWKRVVERPVPVNYFPLVAYVDVLGQKHVWRYRMVRN